MSHTVTEKDFTTRNDDLYYTGPLEEAKALIRKEFAVTEQSYWMDGEQRHTVMFGIVGEPVTWDTMNDYGNGGSSEEAWRFALGAEFGPLDDGFEPFDL